MDGSHGLLVIDKPTGQTSRAVVNRAQRWFPRGTRLGHTGTLDPLATGVLVLCVGVATRLTEYVQQMGKTYRAGITLGARSDTDDADGRITPTPEASAPQRERLLEVLQGFVGRIQQVPPAYSAAHVTGQRAYDLARRGADVTLAARVVRIDRIDIERYEYPKLELVVACGKGTYIRSLARDLGERLGCGGYIHALRRTRVGHFNETQALPLDIDRATARGRLLPLATAVAELPKIVISAPDVALLRHGRALGLPDADIGDQQDVAIFDAAGQFLAVGTMDRGANCLRPVKVFLHDAS